MPEKTAQKEPGKKPKPQQEVIVHVPLSRLHDFPNHPFKVRDDEAMQETAESIRQYGVLVPAIVRPREDGGYEIVAGHRRKHGSELAGLQNLPCIVREMDDDTATILMVDSNIQRENILPSERAQAYKMKLEAIRRKAGRPAKTEEKADENNSPQVAANFRADDTVAKDAGISGDTVRRYGTQLKKPSVVRTPSLHTVLKFPCRMNFLLKKTSLWQGNFCFGSLSAGA